MTRHQLALILALAVVPASAIAQSASPDTLAAPVWSARLDAFAYLLPDDPFVMPIVSADRGALHVEVRYQYEDRRTLSAWAGWAFEMGTTVQFEVVPMAGVLIGQTRGFALGLEATLTWKRLEFYSEGEYVFDASGSEGDYHYNWSQLGWQAAPWLTLGLSAQRTRMYQGEFAIERGIFAAVTRGPAELSVFGFNLDGEEPFAILGLGIDF